MARQLAHSAREGYNRRVMEESKQRLQKILAAAGYGSRRACEDLIRQRRVTVNGQVAQLGQKADPGHDLIAVDGKPVQVQRSYTHIAFHKPAGVLSDEGDKTGKTPTARGLVPLPGRLYTVGRLDLRSEGLLLLTDDGELANRLTHPRYEHEKEYRVCVEGRPGNRVLDQWRQGVFLDDRKTAPADVSILRAERGRTWLRIVLRKGRKRQIRRVAAMLGHPVHRLIRVRLGPVHLGELKPGEWRRLSRPELDELEKLEQKKPRDRGRV